MNARKVTLVGGHFDGIVIFVKDGHNELRLPLYSKEDGEFIDKLPINDIEFITGMLKPSCELYRCPPGKGDIMRLVVNESVKLI